MRRMLLCLVALAAAGAADEAARGAPTEQCDQQTTSLPARASDPSAAALGETAAPKPSAEAAPSAGDFSSVFSHLQVRRRFESPHMMSHSPVLFDIWQNQATRVCFGVPKRPAPCFVFAFAGYATCVVFPTSVYPSSFSLPVFFQGRIFRVALTLRDAQVEPPRERIPGGKPPPHPPPPSVYDPALHTTLARPN